MVAEFTGGTFYDYVAFNEATPDCLKENKITFVLEFTLDTTDDNDTVVIAWGGHIARPDQYDKTKFPDGNPYHFRVLQVDDVNIGNKDVQLQQNFADVCGNFIVEDGEQCDDGNNENNDGCNEFCQEEFCGDGIQQANETCDDGNTQDGDGCSAQCNFEDGQVTRTAGYWKTHLTQATAYWPGMECGPDDFVVDDIEEYMGGMWANRAIETDGDKRIGKDRLRMHLAVQLMPAILNNAAFGSSPTGTTLAEGVSALCGNDVDAMRAAHSDMGAFNESGDDLPFPEGFNSKALAVDSKEIADKGFWDQPNLPGLPAP